MIVNRVRVPRAHNVSDYAGMRMRGGILNMVEGTKEEMYNTHICYFKSLKPIK